MTDSQISEQLDDSFGDGPPSPTTTSALASGRAALRRRRALTGFSTAVAVVAIAVTFSLTGGGGSPDAATEIAPAVLPSANGADVDLYVDGSLVKARGVIVLERVPNPMR